MYDVVYGKKYDATKGADIADIAKMIRADIKDAVKAGALPKTRYSVTISRYSGGQSLRVKISAPSTAINLGCALRSQSPVVARLSHDDPRGFPFTPEWMKAAAHVRTLVAAYNYDGSDIQSDYFHVRFYDDVCISVGNEHHAAVRAQWELLVSVLGKDEATRLVHDGDEGMIRATLARAEAARDSSSPL